MITLEEFKKKQLDKCRLIGLDLGSKRIGVSICDEKQLIATPFKTIKRSTAKEVINELRTIIEENDIKGIIIGNPLNMDGSSGRSAQSVNDTSQKIEENINIPICLWVLDLWPESVKDAGNLKSNFIPNLILPIVRYIYKNCDQILVSSKAFVSSVREKSPIKKDIVYMPQWGESTFTDSQNIRYHNNDFEKIEGFKILFAGNIGVAQDFNCIIDAMNKIKNYPIHLVVLGDGRAKKESIEKVQQLGLESNISFLGSFPLEYMPYFFNKSDALLISLKKSIVFSKTIPAKTQSYMAFGKPILTNADGEVSRIIDESNSGLTSNSGNHLLLADNILKLSKISDKEIETMVNNCKKYYKDNFDRKKILNDLEKIIYDITI